MVFFVDLAILMNIIEQMLRYFGITIIELYVIFYEKIRSSRE